MIKYSRQRESIVNFLASRTDHPTAETIYQNIKKRISKHQSWNCLQKPFLA